MANKTQGFKSRFLRALERGNHRVAQAIEFTATDIVAHEAIDEGTLLKSFELRSPSRFVRVIAVTARHAASVENGSRPHWAPFKPILAWVKRNLARTDAGLEFKPRPGTGARRLRATVDYRFKDGSVMRVHPAHVEVARAVQAKIAREGTKPVRYMRRSVAFVAPRAGRLFQEAFAKEGLA